jgi:hypothetical protein
MLSRGSTAIHWKNERTPFATRLENITTTLGASRHKMRERSRLRREASAADQRHDVKSSSHVPRVLPATIVTDMSHNRTPHMSLT